MKVIEQVNAAFEHAIAEFNESPALRRLFSQELEVRHYASILREFFHYTKENPQLQALATAYFRGHERTLVAQFLRHAASEVGHDRMALDDLKALGVDIADIPVSRPLPATKAFTAFAFYQLTFANPVGYLGVVYFLEHMPTRQGQRYGEALLRAGVPANALSFLQEHVAVDVGHNRAMDEYLEVMVQDEEDLEAVIYAIRVAAVLYGALLWSAIQRADTGVDYGIDSVERRRRGGVANKAAAAA